jgi:hypothetical protein
VQRGRKVLKCGGAKPWGGVELPQGDLGARSLTLKSGGAVAPPAPPSPTPLLWVHGLWPSAARLFLTGLPHSMLDHYLYSTLTAKTRSRIHGYSVSKSG